MATQTQEKQEAVDLQQLAIWTVVAAVASAVINALLFIVTQSQFEGAMAQGQALSVTHPIGASIAFIVIGGIVLAVMGRFLSNPIAMWRNVAIVVLLLSLLQPVFLLEGEYTITTQLILGVMHIIAGAITIFLLTTRTAK